MAEGLSAQEARKRLEKHGFNEIEEKKKFSRIDILKRQFSNVLIWILVIAAGISYFTGGMIEFYFILFIIGIITVTGFLQEWKAEKALKELKKLSEPKVDVVRDGETIEIESREIVPGDILKLSMGDKIPADAQVTQSIDLRLDQSAITGESKAANKKEEETIYSGTIIVHGKGEAEVTATGMDTEIGKIAEEIQEKEQESPLHKKIRKLGKHLGIIALTASLLIFLLGTVKGAPLSELLIVTLALAVASIPEALPLTLTLTLSIGMRDLAKKNAIVRKMLAVESLGSTTVICTDKTGTLTKNEMTVEKIYTYGKEFKVTGVGYEPSGKIKHQGKTIRLGDHHTLLELIKGAVLCNNSTLVHNEEYTIKGSPTEGALLTLGHKAGMRKEELMDKHPRQEEHIFTSKRKMMSTINKDPDINQNVSFVKGAPGTILEKSTHLDKEGEKIKLTREIKQKIREKNRQYTQKSLRVLAVGYRPDPKNCEKKYCENSLIFLGLVAMRDPPRKGVKETIRKCKEAGINIKMITGDNAFTAKAIAQQIELTDNPQVMTGKELEELSQEKLIEKADEIDIYARTLPEHKHRLVKAIHEHGEIVAMTGDGVNDAPAVKKADVGVGMGKKGTDVTKEASDVILQDDNFQTLVTAITDGRRIYENIEKFTSYLISGNFTQVIIIALGIALLGFEYLPLTALQILFLNVIGEEFPAISLGLEPADEDIMKKPPRETDIGILHKRNIIFVVAMALFMALLSFLVFIYADPVKNLEFARTAIFITLTLIILVHTFNFRSLEKTISQIDIFGNKWILISTTTTLVMLLITVYFPPVAEIFSHVSVGHSFWVIAMIASLITLVFIEGLKKISNKYIDLSYMWKQR